MKISRVVANNRKSECSVVTGSGVERSIPYSKAAPRPSADDPIVLGREAFTYVLASGKHGCIHIEQVLEYNEDPSYLADLLTYKLTVEARQRIQAGGLSRRQLAKRLSTSVPQLYRLLDPSNTGKSIRQLVALLHVLGCSVDLVVKNAAEERPRKQGRRHPRAATRSAAAASSVS